MPGPLPNLAHERFAQAVHRRIFAGAAVKPARTEAYREAGFTSADSCIADNARKLAGRVEVKARIAELAAVAAELAAVDASYVLLHYKRIVEGNVDDYLSAPDEQGRRTLDLGKVPRDKLALLTELYQEEVYETQGKDEPPVLIRKIKIKREDRIAALLGIRQMCGLDMPKKVAVTDSKGQDVSLEDLIAASFALAAKKATEA